MESVTLRLAAFFALFSVGVHSTNNSYVIVTPRIFRPGMQINVSVLILKEDPPGTPVNVRATFLINSVPISSASGQFRAGSLGFLQLSIPFGGFPEESTHYDAYTQLRVVGSGGLTFNTSDTRQIVFSNKGFSIYIQTDKGIYKPKQTVHTRIVAVYPDLKVHTGKMTIQITDPKNNKLALWKDEIATSGFVSREFELSSQPNMGKWKISVEVEGRTEIKTFEVGEYVLPKFKVDILANSYASFGNGRIDGYVSAKYTNGIDVKGMAKLCFFVPRFPYNSKCNIPHPQREFQIDGNHSFSISADEITDLFRRERKSKFPGNPYALMSELTVNVSVTEDLTGKTYYGTRKIKIRYTDVILTYDNTNPKTFKTNVKTHVLFKATRPDGTPVSNKIIRVRIRYPDPHKPDWSLFTTNKNGYITVPLLVTSNTILGIEIIAETNDSNGHKIYKHAVVSRFRSRGGTFMQLTTEKYKVEAGDEIICNVTTTDFFSFLHYMILSRGNTIISNRVSYPKGEKHAILKILTSSVMSPWANIVVYYVREDGEIVADSLKIHVDGAFENLVSVQFSSTDRKPGEDVKINIKASPHSRVGLLAVDKSVLLLKKDNDFSVSQVMRELDSYGASDRFQPFGYRPRRGKRSLGFIPWYPSATTAWDIFQNAGVTVLTDCVDFKPRWRAYLPARRKSRIPSLASVQKVRSFFPETWLWKDVETDSAGHAQVSATSPDTITSWVLSGFAVSNVTGFGVANEKPQLRVFQPFFLSMDLPYSVIRGEQVAIKVVIFNYENEDMEVHVTLKSSPDWKNINRKNSVSNNVEDQGVNGDVISVIKVPANSGETVSFPIIPIKLGNIPVTISAQSITSADAVRRNLVVEPEGIDQGYSYSLLLDLNSSPSFRKELELALPSNTVKGSAKAVISVIGDIMGSSMSGIERLLKMPYGCGEQNMINFAPSMFIRAYLETVGQLTLSISKKSIRFMTSGYQRELSYQHKDGSYSAFGEKFGKKRPGSLWLTAFVVKSFSRARSYIYIDPASLSKSVEFMLSWQQKSGYFKEPGSVSSYLQGGLKSSNREALTAYVLISLLEYGNKHSKIQIGISSAVRYLKSNIQKIRDSYTLAITAYAMELADDPVKETLLNELVKNAVIGDGTLHWTDGSDKTKTSPPWFRPYYRPRSSDIEMTSYVLLVYAHRRDRQNGLPIARWLAQQRNSLGGYSSTQDTVVGLQALSEFAPLVFSRDLSFSVNVELSDDLNFSKSFQVDKSNMVVLQKIELPTVQGKIVISANGKGIGMLQIGVTYNVDKAPTDKSFNLAVQVITADTGRMETRSCVTYAGDGNKSGMAILEFGLPSGFNLDHDEVEKLLSNEGTKVKRIETPGRKAVLYFDQVLKTEELCVNLTFLRTHATGKPQPIPVVVYDYYKPEKRAVVMYSAQERLDLCSVCTDCTNCGKPSKPNKPIAENCESRGTCQTTSRPAHERTNGCASNSQTSLAQFFMAVLTILLYAFY